MFLWAVGLLLFVGLPNYYRQTPGKVPSFYKSVFRRKIILWNFAVVLIQNWFLSAPYGRNWSCKPYPSTLCHPTRPIANKSSPLELPTRRPLANRHPMRSILRRSLGPRSLLPGIPLEIARLDPPRLRLRTGRPPLGPDLVGSIRSRPLPPLGYHDSRHRERICSRGTSIARRLALARRPGHPARRGLWDDPPADVDEIAYLLYAPGGAGPGFYSDDLCPCLCAK